MHERLIAAIRDVRRRWRLRLAMRGAAVVSVAALFLIMLAAWVMDRLKFESAAVIGVRAVAYALIVTLAWLFLIRPLRRRVSDAQVALYLEEHEPALSGQIAGAVQFGGLSTPGVSPALVDRLVASAVERCEADGGARAIERPDLRRSAMIIGAAAGSALLLLVINPPFVARGLPFLFPMGSLTASPYAIDIAPGDTVLPRGADLEVVARLRNFDADVVTLALRHGAAWERFDMPGDSAGRRALTLFALDSSTAYYVEAGGVRSRVYTVDVRDLPYVKTITITYHPPAYTGLPAQRQDDGGDIAALPGTRVVITVTPTLAAGAGALVIAEQGSVTLTADTAGALTGTFDVRREGSYRVHLAGADGHLLPASPDYSVTLLEDRPPVVTLGRPGRDITATSIEELLVEARADDDYGVRGLELVYAVNGGTERVVPMHQGPARRQVTGAHTLYLEESSLTPGDVVSLFARARDARPGSAAATSDIYFVTIRPFDRTYREAEQGQGGGDGPGGSVGQLSQRQREIVAGTFNLLRDRARYTDAETRQHLATLALAQGRLREEVNTLAQRLVTRGVTRDDSGLAQVAAILPEAVREMRAAEDALGRREPQPALAPEQRALQQLQRAEAIFDRETQIARGEGGQGGGGEGREMSDELRDLFELDMDRMRNQYEQVQRGQREQAQREVDELLERLRELARRQQQENERREAARRGGAAAGPSAGGQGQRGMADEAEELARRLERLTREEPSAEMTEAARRLQQASDAMRRAAAEGRSTQGAQALEQLRDARRRLEQGRSEGLTRDARELADRARRLAEQQREVAGDVGRLEGDDPQARAERVRRLMERKQQMADEVAALSGDVERVSRDARAEQPEAARRLAEAARGARDARLEDKIRFSRGTLAGRSPEYARAFEEQIGTDVEDLRRRLDDAASAVGESREQRLGRALDRSRELANALEGMGERSRADGSQADRRAGGQEGQASGEAGGRGDRAGTPGGSGRPSRGELRQRLMDFDSLRAMLRRDGVDAGEIDALRATLGRLDSRIAAGDTAALGMLQRDIVDGLKEFEFALRRALAGRAPSQPQLRGTDDVAPEYRRMVEEYYRSLAGRRN